MFDRDRRSRCLLAFSVVLLLLSLPAAARAGGPCNAGVIAASGDDGIGGTGIGGTEPGDDQEGIGGTGFGGDEDGVGGTGVLGTITGFGSVCVNGLEIHYAPDVSVSAGWSPAIADDLAAGQVVWIVAAKREGRLVADSIAVVTELVGRVSTVDAERRVLRVAGESIDVLADAVIFGVPAGELQPALRKKVAVSGLRRANGRIAASRIDRALVYSRANPLRISDMLSENRDLHWLAIEGFLGEQRPGKRFRLGDLEVDAAAAGGQARATEDRVWVRGVLDGSVLRAGRIVSQPGTAGPGDEVVPLPDAGVRRPDVKPEPPRARDVEPRPTPDVTPAPQARPEVTAPDVFEAPVLPDFPIEPTIPDMRDIPIDPGRIDVYDGMRNR